MKCPRCDFGTDDDDIRFCTECSSHLESEPPAKPNDTYDSLIAAVAVIVSVLVLFAGISFVMNKEPAVTLNSDGKFLGSVSITRTGFLDLNQLESVEDTLRIQGNGGLNFAGWYTDPSFDAEFALNKFQQFTAGTVLHAKWNSLDFTWEQEDQSPTRKSVTFTNTTPGEITETTTWTIRDAFKTSGPGIETIVYTNTLDANASLRSGMYDVVMKTTVDGEYERTTKTVTVNGILGETVAWRDYNGIMRQLTYEFDVEDYIKYAKDNRSRDFRFSLLPGYVTWWDPVIVKMASDLNDMLPNGTEQERMNLIASFVNNGLSSNSPNNADHFFYKIPGFHTTDVSVEYYKFPLESLYDRILFGGLGDCEDHAIITAAIARASGFEVAILIMTNPSAAEGHAVAGIRGDFTPPPPQNIAVLSVTASFMEVDGFFACETFRIGWNLWLGNIDDRYKGPGWVWRAFVVP
ncbi:MAG: hypothetical protein FWD92_06345 [Methanomassiliicoccaceae archaeon]|nr:hypothetical protein [Methanomassiliicoccaceae archaeon]